MKEKPRLRKKKIIFECLENKGKTYVKSEGQKVETIGFWLRVITEHFIPCKKCQEELAKQLQNAEELHLGNAKYEPAIELWRKFEIDDETWEEVERRSSTKEEREELECFN